MRKTGIKLRQKYKDFTSGFRLLFNLERVQLICLLPLYRDDQYIRIAACYTRFLISIFLKQLEWIAGKVPMITW
jgi:hypothetical protein